ncbi:MAG: radical SAM protein, partial [Planctomycetes bacterium]|nr:radical SAM protein [Planctomycetota bacterium]
MNDPRFILDPFAPAYLTPAVRASLAERVRAAVDSLRDCRACPRGCRVNRLENETQVCRTGRYARVTSAFAHFGEERCLSGTRGSGTIFFGRCNLRCVFCQNFDISQGSDDEECPPQAMAQTMLALQDRGCHNINLVTPEHVVPQVIEAVAAAIERGLRLPIVYNTSGYDTVESLRQLDGLIDIYMPDFKLWSAQRCRQYVGAEDYADCARR